MRELFPLGTIEESHLPMYLTLWMDKMSPLCMYTMTHTHIWSTAHLKANCWYINWEKIFCQLKRRMPRRLVFKLTQRVLYWTLTKVMSKRMWLRSTLINFPRMRGIRFSTKEQRRLKRLRRRLRRRPKRPRRRLRRRPRKPRKKQRRKPKKLRN